MSPRPSLPGGLSSPCPSCGSPNRLGAVFCGKCGARLLLGSTLPPKVPLHVSGGPRAAFRSFLLSTLAVLLVLSLLLLFWPFFPVGSTGASARVGEPRAALENWDRERLAGHPLSQQVLHEAPLNTYLDSLVPAGRDLRVDIERDRLVLISNEPIGPLTLSTRIVLSSPTPSDPPQVQSLWLGHLPLPPSRAPQLLRGLSRRLALPIDPSLFQLLRVLRLNSSAITLGPPPPPSP